MRAHIHIYMQEKRKNCMLCNQSYSWYVIKPLHKAFQSSDVDSTTVQLDLLIGNGYRPALPMGIDLNLKSKKKENFKSQSKSQSGRLKFFFRAYCVKDQDKVIFYQRYRQWKCRVLIAILFILKVKLRNAGCLLVHWTLGVNKTLQTAAARRGYGGGNILLLTVLFLRSNVIPKNRPIILTRFSEHLVRLLSAGDIFGLWVIVLNNRLCLKWCWGCFHIILLWFCLLGFNIIKCVFPPAPCGAWGTCQIRTD